MNDSECSYFNDNESIRTRRSYNTSLSYLWNHCHTWSQIQEKVLSQETKRQTHLKTSFHILLTGARRLSLLGETPCTSCRKYMWRTSTTRRPAVFLTRSGARRTGCWLIEGCICLAPQHTMGGVCCSQYETAGTIFKDRITKGRLLKVALLLKKHGLNVCGSFTANLDQWERRSILCILDHQRRLMSW
jgi:hypothetical protein